MAKEKKETKKAAGKKADESAEAAAPEGKTGKKKKLIAGAVGGAMVLQGAIIAAVKLSGAGPDEAAAEVLQALAEQEAAPNYEEILVTQFRAPNEKSKVMYIYDAKVAVRVEEKNLAEVQALVEHRKSAIEDAFNRVIRGADPDDLRQDDLKWLREQFLFELERVAETKGLVNQLYLPTFMKRAVD